ncbi:hypothetical protein BpHYR1_027520 [Brachionus plicatilis]|uniref:Uncharacterized protein n=1 Tax=Brachionus plicatilis TaxID=10195 RepID=A0A3M7SP29_BRAPC|nr:hypothetical protein BpHYR1_027520 [Brachionus plicatilis]
MSSSGDSEVKVFKKQHTYSSEMHEKEPVSDPHLLRSNSLINKHTLPTVNPANTRSLLVNSHNLSYGNDLSNLHNDKTSTDPTNFKLHRSNEVENLTTEIQDSQSSENSKNLRRTLELENLNEIVNDE